MSKSNELSWDTGNKAKDNCIDKCDYSEKFIAGTILVAPEIQGVISQLCKKVKKEWQMLLKGTVEESGDIIVNGYHIPNQEVTGASVKNLDCVDAKFIEEQGIVATIHSHGEMGVFFSSTDDEKTNTASPIRYHIVVNNKGDYKAVYKFTLPCGMITMLPAKMKALIEVEDIEIEGIDKIKEERYIKPASGYYCGGYGYRGAGELTPDEQYELWETDLIDSTLDGRKHALTESNAHIYKLYK